MVVSNAKAALRAAHSGLQFLVATIRARSGIALWAAEQVNYETYDAREEYKEHPQDGTIHASGFCISRHPDKQSDVQYEDKNREEDKGAATGQASCGTGCTVGRTVLCEG